MKPILFILAFLSFGATAEAALQLENWKGKYPANEDPKFKNIFEVPEVKRGLSKMLSPAEVKLLTNTYALMTPIELYHGFLVVMVSKPHWAPSDNAMLVIDLKQEQFHVGFYQLRKSATVKWISSDGDVHDFPKEVQDAFYYMHHPE